VKRSKLLPHGGDLNEGALADLRLRFKETVDFARQVGRIKMTDEAIEGWSAVYPKLSREQPGLVGAVIARAEAQVIRLTLIFALLDRRDAIAFEHLEAALAVWSYCEASALRIFGDSLGDPVADEILRAIRQSGRKGMTRTDIYNFFGRHRGIRPDRSRTATACDNCEDPLGNTTDRRSPKRNLARKLGAAHDP